MKTPMCPNCGSVKIALGKLSADKHVVGVCMACGFYHRKENFTSHPAPPPHVLKDQGQKVLRAPMLDEEEDE